MNYCAPSDAYTKSVVMKGLGGIIELGGPTGGTGNNSGRHNDLALRKLAGETWAIRGRSKKYVFGCERQLNHLRPMTSSEKFNQDYGETTLSEHVITPGFARSSSISLRGKIVERLR